MTEMSDRKRKASQHQELTSPRNKRRDTLAPANTMTGLPDLLMGMYKIVGKVTGYFNPWNHSTMSTTSSGSANDLNAPAEFEPVVQTLKYQNSAFLRVPRTRQSRGPSQSKVKRTRSAGDTTKSRSGCRQIDLEGLGNEEARRIVDSLWVPPEFPFAAQKTKRTAGYLPTPPPESLASDELEDQRLTHRRHSEDSAGSPRTPISSFSSSKHVSTSSRLRPNHDHARSLGTPESQGNETIIDKLHHLLIDELDLGHAPLRTATHKLVGRERIQKEQQRKAQEEAHRARKERRLKRHQPLRPLIEPLDPKWEDAIFRIQSLAIHDVISKGIEGTPLARKDFETLLRPRAWLNDEIINAYLEWIVAAANAAAAEEAQNHGEQKSTVPKFITQNSFFHESLLKKGPESTTRLMKRKKAPGATFMEVDSMFIPICRNSHWTVGVVRPVAKTIEYFDSMGGEAQRQQFTKLMRTWLKHQLGNAYKEDEWTTPRTECAYQSNGYDCGVFVCTNTFCVAYGLDTLCYEEQDMTQQRKNIAAVLMNQGFVKDFAWGNAGLLA